MKKEFEKFIEQVKKYHLEKELLEKIEKDKSYLKNITEQELNNFNHLKIKPEEIPFPKMVLLNENLLKCEDYLDRIEKMTKIKNWDFPASLLCENKFLKSKNYYEDMEMLSQATSLNHIASILSDNVFINSPYHKEDLERMVNATLIDSLDLDSKNTLLMALGSVSTSKASINSPYHREDMKTIMSADIQSLQYPKSLPTYGLNHLAIDEDSLKDPYHVENMQLLSKNPKSRKYLYRIMTNPIFIKGKYYRKEVDALLKAPSNEKCLALYYYMICLNANASLKYHAFSSNLSNKWDLYDDLSKDLKSRMDLVGLDELATSNNMFGRESNEYLKNLELLNNMDEKYVVYASFLLSNKDFDKSIYKQEDLKLLCTIQKKKILQDAFSLMSNPISLNSHHHLNDIEKIIQTEKDFNRRLLYIKALNKESLKSPYHDEDMNYIRELEEEELEEKTYDRIKYYLFDEEGITNPNHRENLERLRMGEKEIIPDDNLYEIVKKNLSSEEDSKSKILSKIKKVFKRDK